jgi:ADP-ribosyl-[dinitrogen reductase] hydrolase
MARQPFNRDISPTLSAAEQWMSACLVEDGSVFSGSSLWTSAVRDWGAAAVITLVEPKELTLLKVERLGEEVLRRNMLWFHLPIVDASIPDQRFEDKWEIAGEEIRALLRGGRDVLVHCRGGLGRAGMIAARLLVELGTEPAEAIARVRAVRPGAIETREQERFVRERVAGRRDVS